MCQIKFAESLWRVVYQDLKSVFHKMVIKIFRLIAKDKKMCAVYSWSLMRNNLLNDLALFYYFAIYMWSGALFRNYDELVRPCGFRHSLKRYEENLQEPYFAC